MAYDYYQYTKAYKCCEEMMIIRYTGHIKKDIIVLKMNRICDEIERLLKLKRDSGMGNNREFSIIAFIRNINAIFSAVIIC